MTIVYSVWMGSAAAAAPAALRGRPNTLEVGLKQQTYVYVYILCTDNRYFIYYMYYVFKQYNKYMCKYKTT